MKGVHDIERLFQHPSDVNTSGTRMAEKTFTICSMTRNVFLSACLSCKYTRTQGALGNPDVHTCGPTWVNRGPRHAKGGETSNRVCHMDACRPTCLYFNSCAEERHFGAEPNKGMWSLLDVQGLLCHMGACGPTCFYLNGCAQERHIGAEADNSM